jgi:uncharacterized SAM-binding protein YcdF (DUF218 family)
MIYIHKVLPIFLSPIFVVLALAVFGVITRRRIWVIAAVGLLYMASMPLVAERLFSRVEQGAERLLPSEVPAADAIVALSAGMGWVKTKNGFVAEWPTPSRFLGGVELFVAGRAPILVFTGGKLPWQQGDETEGEVLRRYAERMQIPARQILVTERAENTEQEAQGARKLFAGDQKKIILVTSAFHMKRARQIFERQGFEVIPYPVNIRVAAEHLTVLSFLPDPRALNATHTALHELLGRLYYQLKHEIKPL